MCVESPSASVAEVRHLCGAPPVELLTQAGLPTGRLEPSEHLISSQTSSDFSALP